jgi:CheY-like chemotaxis protein
MPDESNRSGGNRSAGSGPRRLPDTGIRRKPHVLLVDDDADLREAYAWCMRAAGWHVDTAEGATQALAIATAVAPLVIVMDVHMPDVDGIEATRWLRKQPQTMRVPILACTAFGSTHAAELRAAGFDGVIEKPCPPDELVARVEQFLLGLGDDT